VTSRYLVKATPRTRAIVLELRRLARELEPYLHYASADARDEWRRLQATWPSDLELQRGCAGVSDASLEEMDAKIRRFRKILCAQSK
jgi:hypothetical protein